MLGPGLGWEAANPGGSTSPALHRPRGRACAGRGPACLFCRHGRPGRPSGSSVLPRRPPGPRLQKPGVPPPDWVESPIPGPGAATVSSSVTVSLEGSRAASCLDRRRSQEVLMTGTPAPLFVSPGSRGGGALGSLLGGTQPCVPRDGRGPPGAAPRSLLSVPLGSQPTDPGTGSVYRASEAGPPCVLSSGQDARAWVGAPRAWTVDMGPLDVAGPPDPSDLGTRWEAGAWPTCPSGGPHPVTRPRVRKHQVGWAWAQGCAM